MLVSPLWHPILSTFFTETAMSVPYGIVHEHLVTLNELAQQRRIEAVNNADIPAPAKEQKVMHFQRVRRSGHLVVTCW